MFRGNRRRGRYTGYRSQRNTAGYPIQSIPNDVDDFDTVGERTEPIAQLSMSDYYWAMGVSFTVASLSGLVVLFANRHYKWGINFDQAMMGFFAVWLIGFLICAFPIVLSLKRLSEFWESLFPQQEVPAPIELTISVKDDNNKVAKMIRSNFQVTPHQLVEFASGVINAKKGLSQRTWVDDEKLFTRPEFDNLMAQCEQSGMVEKKGNAANSPRVLTSLGRQSFKEVWENRMDVLE